MRSFLTTLCLLIPLAAFGAPLTNDDVIKMVKGGLADATVMQAIDAAEPGFDTSPDGLVKLKQGGVSDGVIQRIMARKAAAPVPAPASTTATTASACRECGVVESVREIDKPGHASGVGAVAGGVLGGLLGRQIGGDRHKTAGTVVGAVGGAVAGHQIEKYAKSGKTWEIAVRFDEGGSRTFRQDSQPSLQPGEKVRVVNSVVGRM